MRRGKELRCAQIDRLDGIISEMLVETCTPSDGNAVARLQDGFETRACAAAHHAQMPAVRARHQVEDGIRLPVPLRAQHDRVIGPLHYFTSASSSLLRKLQSHRAVAFRIVAPAFPHFDEQEQVHLSLGNLGDLLTGRLPDRLDRLSRLAEHNLALALTLNVDRLLDSDVAFA